jgi:hypothetical protein
MTKLAATPRQLIKPNEGHGRLRVAFWKFTTPAATVLVNDVIELCKLPAGARVLIGHEAHEAMSSGGGTASAQIGIAGATTKYFAATSVDSIGNNFFANSVAQNEGAEEAAEVTLICTATGEAWAGGKIFTGWVMYALD